MSVRIVAGLWFLAGAAGLLRGQSFVTAELRLHTTGVAAEPDSIGNGQVRLYDKPLQRLLELAWDLPAGRISGPGWMNDVRLDVTARAFSPDTPRPTLELMLRDLLQTRMKLRTTLTPKQTPVYVLKRGLVLRTEGEAAPSQSTSSGADECKPAVTAGETRWDCSHVTMTELAASLPVFAAAYVDRPVVDETGIAGWWDFSISIGGDQRRTIGAALAAQVGVKLDDRTVWMQFLTVKSVERMPAEF